MFSSSSFEIKQQFNLGDCLVEGEQKHQVDEAVLRESRLIVITDKHGTIVSSQMQIVIMVGPALTEA